MGRALLQLQHPERYLYATSRCGTDPRPFHILVRESVEWGLGYPAACGTVVNGSDTSKLPKWGRVCEKCRRIVAREEQGS